MDLLGPPFHSNHSVPGSHRQVLILQISTESKTSRHFQNRNISNLFFHMFYLHGASQYRPVNSQQSPVRMRALVLTLQIRDLNLGEAPSFLRSRGDKTGEEAESKWPSEEKSCPLAQCPQSLVIKN